MRNWKKEKFKGIKNGSNPVEYKKLLHISIICIFKFIIYFGNQELKKYLNSKILIEFFNKLMLCNFCFWEYGIIPFFFWINVTF